MVDRRDGGDEAPLARRAVPPVVMAVQSLNVLRSYVGRDCMEEGEEVASLEGVIEHIDFVSGAGERAEG